MSTARVPVLLYHYYDESTGPFRSLGDSTPEEARALQSGFAQRPEWFASRRPPDYVDVRFELEERLRARFVERGGRPERARPHYLTLGRCDWLFGWYPNPAFGTIELGRVDPATISFTYGDLFPAFRWNHGGAACDAPPGALRSGGTNPNCGRVFLVRELPGLIREHGLPQEVNPTGAAGPLRYIEAQLWSDVPISGFVGVPAG